MKRVTTLDDCLGKVLKKQPELKDAMPPAAITRAVRNAKRAAKASKDLKGELVNEFTAILRATEKDLAAAANAQNPASGASRAADGTLNSAPSPGGLSEAIVSIFNPVFRLDDARLNNRQTSGRTEGIGAWMSPGGNIAGLNKFSSHNLAAYAILHGEDIPNSVKRLTKELSTLLQSRLGEKFVVNVDIKNGPATYKESGFRTYIEAESKNHFLAEPDDFSADEMPLIVKLNELAIRLDSTFSDDTKYYDEIQRRGWVRLVKENQTLHAQSVGKLKVAQRRNLTDLALYHGWKLEIEELPSFESSRAADGTLNAAPAPRYQSPPGLADTAQRLKGTTAAPSLVGTIIQKAYAGVQRGRSSVMVPIRAVWMVAKAAHPELTPAGFMEQINAMNDTGTALIGLSETREAVAAAGPFRVGAAGTEMAMMPQSAGETITSLPPSSFTDFIPEDLQRARSDRAKLTPAQIAGEQPTNDPVLGLRTANGGLRLLDGYHRYLAALEHGWNLPVRMQTAQDGLASAPSPGGLSEADAEYLKAAQAGDMDRARSLVQQASLAVNGWASYFINDFSIDLLNKSQHAEITEIASEQRPPFLRPSSIEENREPVVIKGLKGGWSLRDGFWRVSQMYAGGHNGSMPALVMYGPKALEFSRSIADYGVDVAEEYSPVYQAAYATIEDAEGNTILLSQRFPQKSPAAETSVSEDSEGQKTSFNGAATGSRDSPPSAAEVNPDTSRDADGALNSAPSPGGLSEAESRKILSEARKKRTELESHYTSDAHDVWSESDARENLESELDREPSPEEVADYIAKSQRQHNDEVKELLWEHGTTINHLVWQQIAENALTSLGVKSDGYSNKSEASYWYLPGATAQNGDALGDAYRIRVASHDPVYTQSDTLVQYDLREILDDNHALEAAIESVNDLKKEITKLNPSFESSRAADGALNAAPAPGNRNAKLVASLPADVVAAAQRIVSTGAVSAADADTLKQSAVASLLDTADAAATVDNLRDLLGVADDSYDRQYAQGSQAVDRAFANRAALKSLAARVHREKTLSAADEQWIRENAPMYVGKTRDATLRNVSRFYVNTLVGTDAPRAADGTLASAPRPVTAAQDAEYMAAVESGDVAKQRAMVDAAAKAADVTYVAKIPVERIIRSSLPGVNRPLSDGVAAPIILERTGRNGEKFALVDGYHRLDGMIDKGETFVTAIILNDKDSRALEDNSSREIERVQSEHKGESADPITRDAEGNVIPLSERFNPESDSILRSAPRPDDAKAKAIKEAIATMPPYWREALELSMQGTPPAEIAQKMQRSETAVGHLLNVANGRLRFLLAAAEGKLKPIVQVEDGIVKAKRGRPDLAMSGNALMAALDQQMGDSEVVHRAEMRELADTMFTGWPAETLALVKRWMDSGGIMLSPQNLPDGLRKIIEEASARGAGDMLMQAAANHALNEARFNNAPMIEQAALGLAQRFNGGVQARAFGMRQDTIHNPMERHALYIQKALLAPSDEVERSLKKNPEMRERYLAQLVADAEAMKKHLKGLGMDIDAWFAELKEIKAEGEAMIPQEAQKPLARMPEKQREGIKAVLQGATWAEAAANFKLPVGELIGAYTALFDSVNRIGVEAAQAAKNAALAAAPAMSFAEQVGLPRPPTGNIDPNSRLVDTPKSRQHQAKKAKAALSNPKKVAAAIQEVTVGRAGWIDKASEYWRMSILTGPQTWVVNASSGVTFGFYRHLVQKLGSAGLAGLARMIGVKDMEDAPALSDMPHIISAAIKAWKPSLRLAMRSMRHNARLFNMYADGTLGIDPGAEKWDAKEAGLKVNEQGNYANEKFDPALSREHWFGKTMDALSFRILLLADEFVRSFFGRIEMAGQARQLARSEPRLRARAVELEAKARAVLAGKNYTLKWSGGDGHYYATEQVQRVDGSTSTERVTWAEWRKVLPDSMRESLAIMGRDLYLHGGLDAMLSKMDGEALEKRIEQLTKPDSVAWHRAVEGANTFTFQNKIGEGKRLIDGLDAFAKIIMDAKKGKYGWLKHPANFVFPFVATPLNIFKTGVTMSPVGGLFAVMDAVRAYRLRKQGGLEQADKIMNAQRGLEEMVNQIVAWGLVLVIADMVEPGDDDEGLPLMTGTTPYTITSQGEREIAYRTAPPQSIRLFGRWFSYARLDPFGSVLANIADSVLAFRSEQPSDVAMGELGIKMVRSIKDKTFLQGLSDVLNAVQDPERFFPRWFTNIATGFIPNLIRQPIRSADPLIREGDLAKDMGFWESFGRRVGYSVVPQSAMPAVSVWGQDENKNTGMGGPASDFVMRLLWPGQTRGTEGVDYIDAALYRYNQTHDKAFGVTAPSREIPKIINGKPVRVSLDDAEYDEMTRKAGQAARIAIGDRFKGRDLTETDVDLIKAIISREQSAYRDAAFAQAFQKRGLAK